MTASTQPARLRPFRPQPFGRYTLLSHLATGGMGEIYLARLEGMQGFEKLCVIKKILPQLAADSDFVERFVGEARTLVRLSHGSIAQVLDMGVHEGEAYMALEYVDGKDLRKVAARVRDRQVPLPLTFILYTMGRVLDALAYAHRKKDDDGEELRLVHRDISPQNILISYEGEVKVIDFGLAKSRLSAAKTNPSIILGKFLYMSPEQARHQPVDRRSDLYAVGLCLYELISGKNPFDDVHPGELMTVVSQPKIAPLDEVEPLTPRAVTALVTQALAVDPSQRFQTAEEFRGQLQACLMTIDASAGPESVSRFMRELFAADFQSERRLLATLKELPRVAAGEPSPEDGGPAPRPATPAMLPPKPLRLDGPVQPLSFHPTPRSRDDSGPVTDGETRPGVVMDEPTRPAFPLEALEEAARARSARALAAAESASSVEVRPEAFERPAPLEPPPPDLRPTELALPSVQPRFAPVTSWDDGAEPPAFTMAESDDPRSEPFASVPSEPRPARAAGVPPPPPLPSRTAMPPVVPAVPATGLPPPFLPEPRPPAPPAPVSASPRPGAQAPASVPPPPPDSTPSWGTPSVEPSTELGVEPRIAESEGGASWDSLDVPIFTSEEMDPAQDASRPGEVDTHPRFALPSRNARTEDTQPRVTLSDDTDPHGQQHYDDTRSGVVLDEALLRDVEGATGEPEEKSGPNRSRGAPRRARAATPSTVGLRTQGPARRTGSIPAGRPSAAPVRVDEDDAVRASLTPPEETRRTPISGRPGSEPVTQRPGEGPRRPAMPPAGSSRKGMRGMAVGLVVLLLAGAVLALAFSPALRAPMGLAPAIVEGPPPPRPMGSTRGGALGATGASPRSDGTADVGSASAPRAEDDSQAAPGSAEAAVPRAEAAAPETEASDDADLLAPLPAPKQAPVKRASPPKKVRDAPRVKALTPLQLEWRETSTLYNKLESQYSCIQLGLWCNRYEDIRNEVEAAGDGNNADTLRKVKEMKRQLLAKQRELE